MTTSEIIQIITATVGVMCFSLLGNTRGKKLLFTAIGGFLSWALFILLGRLIASETMRYFIVSILLSAYSEIMARVLKTPTTTFIIPSLIPLIPGSSLYYTMASAFSGNLDTFLEKALQTLELAAALAIGIILVSAFTGIILKLMSKHHLHIKGEQK